MFKVLIKNLLNIVYYTIILIFIASISKAILLIAVALWKGATATLNIRLTKMNAKANWIKCLTKKIFLTKSIRA